MNSYCSVWNHSRILPFNFSAISSPSFSLSSSFISTKAVLYFASFSFCSYKNTFCFSPMIKCGISLYGTQIMIIYNWLSYLSTFNFDFLEFILIFMWVLRRWNLQKQSQVGIIEYFNYINIIHFSNLVLCICDIHLPFQ